MLPHNIFDFSSVSFVGFDWNLDCIRLVIFLSRRSLLSGYGAISSLFHNQGLSRDVGHIEVFGLRILD